MCNLYSLTKGQAAIRDWFRASYDRTGNLPLFPGIFPDQMAPIVRNGAEASVSLLWRVGACRGRRSSEARRLPTFAISAARIGAAGSASKTAASCPRLRFANTPIRSPARRRNGSRSAKTGRCLHSLVFGRYGTASRTEERASRWEARVVWLSHHSGERDRRSDPSQGDAGYSDDAGRGRPVAFGRRAQGSRITTTAS